MKPLGSLLFLSSIVMLSSIATGDDGPPPSKATTKSAEIWGTPRGGLRLSLRCQVSKYEAGAPVGITVVVRNDSKDDRIINQMGDLNQYTIKVWDASGVPARPTEFWRVIQARRPRSVEPVRLNSGHEIESEFMSVSRQYDMTVTGTYYIRVSRVIGDDSKSAEGDRLELQSNTVRIVIYEPGDKP